MKKIYPVISWLLVVLFLCAGCEKTISDVKNKFTRKKKGGQQQVTRFYEPEEDSAAVYPNATLYKNHYAYWKIWTQELIDALQGDNLMKQKQAAESALDELHTMQSLLADTKKDLLNPLVEEMQQMVTGLNQGKGGSSPMRMSMMKQAEQHLLHGTNQFSPKDMANCIKEDVFVDVEAAANEEDSQEQES